MNIRLKQHKGPVTDLTRKKYIITHIRLMRAIGYDAVGRVRDRARRWKA